MLDFAGLTNVDAAQVMFESNDTIVSIDQGEHVDCNA